MGGVSVLIDPGAGCSLVSLEDEPGTAHGTTASTATDCRRQQTASALSGRSPVEEWVSETTKAHAEQGLYRGRGGT